jgi:sulfonate transport system substrate-binding protein
MSNLHRRQFLAAGGMALLAACARPKSDAHVLRVGDQRGGQKVVLAATGGLAKVPYTIEWAAFPNAAPLLQALDIEAIDTGYGGDAAFVFAVGSGARIKVIGAEKTTGPGPVIVVRGNSPIHDLNQLAGLKIATPRGSISHNLVLAALEAQGKPLDAVTFAFLSPADGEAALNGGSVDAWAIWAPNSTLAVQRGARILPGGEDLVPTYALEFASEQAIVHKRALLQDFSNRLYTGWQWAADNPVPNAHLMEQETGLAASVWLAVAAQSKRLPVPVSKELIAAQQQTADRYFRAGLMSKKIDIATAFDTSFHG